MECGGQCVMMDGALKMQQLCAGSWDTLLWVRHLTDQFNAVIAHYMTD